MNTPQFLTCFHHRCPFSSPCIPPLSLRTPSAAEFIAKHINPAEGMLLLLDEGEDRQKMMLGVKNDKSKEKMAQTKLTPPVLPRTPPDHPNPPPVALIPLRGCSYCWMKGGG